VGTCGVSFFGARVLPRGPSGKEFFQKVPVEKNGLQIAHSREIGFPDRSLAHIYVRTAQIILKERNPVVAEEYLIAQNPPCEGVLCCAGKIRFDPPAWRPGCWDFVGGPHFVIPVGRTP
jgi:hypothetical protein